MLHRFCPVKKDSPVTGIIVKFVCCSIAESIMTAKTFLRFLSATLLGFDQDTPVYMNWSLRRDRRMLFANVRWSKREKQLSDVWVDRSERIWVKCSSIIDQ